MRLACTPLGATRKGDHWRICGSRYQFIKKIRREPHVLIKWVVAAIKGRKREPG